ncbi:MAG: DUF6089 family protein [Saprospiraceae bacterium]|nr:DUF6089 family protein [Saprospiraceae bacterium]
MKFSCIFASILLFNVLSFAQYHEVGLTSGTSNYLGDLVPQGQFFLEMRFAGGTYYQFHPNPYVGIRTSFIYGQIAGDDQNSAAASGRRQRNLHFKSNIFESATIVQVSPLPFLPTKKFRPIVPYAYLGTAVFHTNPKAYYQGEWVELQPLGTEGQGMSNYPNRRKYKRTQFSMPFGGGIRFSLSQRVNISIEYGWRKTFTDYIDDISIGYVPLNELEAGNGQLAAALSNRMLDANGNQIELLDEPRGLPAKDWYTFMQVMVGVNLYKFPMFKTRKKPKKKKKYKFIPHKWF